MSTSERLDVLLRADLLQVVREAVTVVLEVPADALDETTALLDLGADSLAVVELAEVSEAAVAARTGRRVRLDDEVLDDLRTLGDAVTALERALS